MDLMSGGDLARRIAAGPIAFADDARWTAEAADAVQHAHELRDPMILARP
jgi:hypothetical protein